MWNWSFFLNDCIVLNVLVFKKSLIICEKLKKTNITKPIFFTMDLYCDNDYVYRGYNRHVRLSFFSIHFLCKKKYRNIGILSFLFFLAWFFSFPITFWIVTHKPFITLKPLYTFGKQYSQVPHFVYHNFYIK